MLRGLRWGVLAVFIACGGDDDAPGDAGPELDAGVADADVEAGVDAGEPRTGRLVIRIVGPWSECEFEAACDAEGTQTREASEGAARERACSRPPPVGELCGDPRELADLGCVEVDADTGRRALASLVSWPECTSELECVAENRVVERGPC